MLDYHQRKGAKVSKNKFSPNICIFSSVSGLIGAWLTEKSFAATPYTCYDEIHNILNELMLNSKDFEGDYAPVQNERKHYVLH